MKELSKEGHGCIYVACEAGIMGDIRQHSIGKRSVDVAPVTTRGYWKHGTVNHPGNDYGAGS